MVCDKEEKSKKAAGQSEYTEPKARPSARGRDGNVKLVPNGGVAL